MESKQYESTIQVNQKIINEKESEFNKITKDIENIQEIYKDLALLVQDQGQHLNIISDNIEEVVSQTSQAHIQLQKAEKRQKKYVLFVKNNNLYSYQF